MVKWHNFWNICYGCSKWPYLPIIGSQHFTKTLVCEIWTRSTGPTGLTGNQTEIWFLGHAKLNFKEIMWIAITLDGLGRTGRGLITVQATLKNWKKKKSTKCTIMFIFEVNLIAFQKKKKVNLIEFHTTNLINFNYCFYFILYITNIHKILLYHIL